MRSALANPGSAVAAQGFLSVPGILESQELTSLQDQGRWEDGKMEDGKGLYIALEGTVVGLWGWWV